MRIILFHQLSFLLLIAFWFASCKGEETAPADSASPVYIVPHIISADGDGEQDGNYLYVNDYSNALHALFMISGNSRASEYGHENYRPELFPDEMNARAERWLDLMHDADNAFNQDGLFVNRYVGNGNAYISSGETDLSIYPHLVYSYHMHHRGSRFDDQILFERLSRETTNFIVMPGRYLLNHHFEEGRFIHQNGRSDHKSMSYGLGGIHGHGYAWIVWEKPEGADNMGVITEEALEAWLDFGIDDMLQTYRQIADVLEESWIEEASVYDFGDGTVWHLDAIGAMIRGKKTMYDALYMFGDDSDRELARTVFERTAAMFEAALDLVEPWGLPDQIEFTGEGVNAATAEVSVYDWYQFLNHFGGGFSFDREREGTSEFINSYRKELGDQFPDFYDRAMRGILDYHIGEQGTVVNSVSYEDGSILDERLMVSTLVMFLTVAGNIYTNGYSFARADDWDSVSDDIAERSRDLYDIKFRHIGKLESVVFGD